MKAWKKGAILAAISILTIIIYGTWLAGLKVFVLGLIILGIKKVEIKERKMNEGSEKKTWYLVYVLAAVGFLYVLSTIGNISGFHGGGMIVSFILGFLGGFIVTFLKTRNFERSLAIAIVIGSTLYFWASLDTTPEPYS